MRPYFDAYKPYLAIEKADILQANEDFFRAINEGNSDMMHALWMRSDDTLCIRADDNIVRNGHLAIMQGT